jgi:tRNA(Ile)-lysidine synthase TilS/MesJ
MADAMQRVLGHMRKAITEFGLIENGDRIAVGVSGGKDSLVLLQGLKRLQRFIGIDYEVIGVTLDPRFGGQDTDYSKVAQMCKEIGVEYVVKPSDIGTVVFDIYHSTNPCSLCARMRRGALHELCQELGCNKLALGHNYDDVVETFVMNLFQEGRVGCFAPISYLERRDLFVIRPLVLAPENEVRAAALANEFPIVKSPCPADGKTNRQKTKEWLLSMEKQDHGFTYRLFGALRRSGVDGWGYPEMQKELFANGEGTPEENRLKYLSTAGKYRVPKKP